MSTQTRDMILLAVALFTTVGCGYHYVVAVHHDDRALSKAAAVAFVFFGVVAVVFLVRVVL